MSEPAAPAFANTEKLAGFVKSLLIASAFLAAIAVVSDLAQWHLLTRASRGAVTLAEANANDARERQIALYELLIYLGTATVFITWFYRSHKNLAALGNQGMKFGSGWAIGGFFVPILSLVRPFEVMKESWHGSDPAALDRDLGQDGAAARNHLGAPPVILWWWGLFLAAGAVGSFLIFHPIGSHPTITEVKVVTALQMTARVLRLPGAVLAIIVVDRLTRRQSERRQALLLRQRQPDPATAEEVQPIG